MMRVRQLEIQPGGIVPWHSHADRPALIYVVSGEIVEIRQQLRRADRAQGRRGRARDARHVALVAEQRQGRRSTLLSFDILHGDRPTDAADDVTSGARRLTGTDSPPLVRGAAARAHDRPDRLPDPGRSVRDAGHPAGARRRLRRDARRPWASPSTPAPSAWRSAALAVALFGRRIDRRRGILLSLALLAIPTALLATAPDLPTVHRCCASLQGLCMSTAFALTLAYLGEHAAPPTPPAPSPPTSPATSPATCSAACSAAGLADHLGLAANFYVFAALNLAGAVLVWFTRRAHAADAADGHAARASPFASWLGASRAIPRCAPPSPSASASCSPSSAPSPT